MVRRAGTEREQELKICRVLMWQEPVVHTNFGDNRSPSSAFFKEKKAEFSKECIREERIGAGRKTREQKNGEKES